VSPEANRAAVLRAYEGLAGGDATAFLALLDDDIVYTLYGDHALARTYRGRQDFLEHLAAPLAARLAGPILLEVDRVLADGEHVVVEARGRAQSTTGERYDQHYCVVFRLAGGRIVEGREYLDTALLGRLMR
jgi:ketosteroid isomerase-like protein